MSRRDTEMSRRRLTKRLRRDPGHRLLPRTQIKCQCRHTFNVRPGNLVVVELVNCPLVIGKSLGDDYLFSTLERDTRDLLERKKKTASGETIEEKQTHTYRVIEHIV